MSTNLQERIDRTAENKLLTVAARVSIALAVTVGIPSGVWLVTSTISHSATIVRHGDRLDRLERQDQMDREATSRHADKIQQIDRLLERLEERTQNILRLQSAPASGGPR